MLQPKRVKHRKMHRGHRRGMALTGNFVAFGEFGIQALEPGWVTARQIEAARRTITHHARSVVAKSVFGSSQTKSVTAKPGQDADGEAARAALDHWVAVVRPGRVMFARSPGVREDLA